MGFDAEPHEDRMPRGLFYDETKWTLPTQYVTVDDARKELEDRLNAIYEHDPEEPTLYIIGVPVGIGKSYIAGKVMQSNENVSSALFLQTHLHYDTYRSFDWYQPQHWWNWLPLTHKRHDGSDENELMCREYTSKVAKILAKGWPLRQNCCKVICDEEWQSLCPFITQWKEASKPVVVLRHDNLPYVPFTGRQRDVWVIDETPKVSVFTNKIKRTLSELYVDDVTRPLIHTLYKLGEDGTSYSGTKLMSAIDAYADDFIAYVKNKFIPVAPVAQTEEEIEAMPANILLDLATILEREIACYRSGESHWLERIFISCGHITILSRLNIPTNAPNRIIVLDAMAETNVEIYRMLFPNRKIVMHTVHAKTVSDVYQVVGHHLGITTVKTNNSLINDMLIAIDMIATMSGVPLERVGVVTHKYLSDAAATLIGDAGATDIYGDPIPLGDGWAKDRVLYYFAQAGSNRVVSGDEPCELLIVFGTPRQPHDSLIEQATCIVSERMKPFEFRRDENGITPLFTQSLAHYGHWKNGKQACKAVLAPTDSDLRALFELGVNEVGQAVGRARPYTHGVKTIVFSTYPIHGIELSGVGENPPYCPEGIELRSWLKIFDRMSKNTQPTFITSAILAEWTGLSEKYIINEKWVNIIASFVNAELRKDGGRSRKIGFYWPKQVF